jgi:uncharacterized YccA/Bax inhibitor family protein
MANNPVFNRIDKQISQGAYAGFGSQRGGTWGAPPAAGDLSAAELQQMYDQRAAGPVQTGRVTLDDVVMKTLGLFAVVVTVAAASWFAVGTSPSLMLPLWLGGMFGGLAIGLLIAFRKTVSVPLIVSYAVFEGAFVGSISSVFEQRWPGVVSTAVLSTTATFAGMFLAYKIGLIKVNDRFRRVFGMAVIGYLLFSLVNVVAAFMGVGQGWGFGGNGMLGIGISIIGVGLAAFSLAADFDAIDRAVAAEVPERYSWLLAHGLIVSLVWLYLELLRLLARMRD